MATNIGPKIGIEGEAQYRKQIADIIQTQKTLKAEMNATVAAFDADASAKEKSAAKTKNLEKQLTAANSKLKEQEKMLDEASKKYGETDKRTMAFRENVAKTKAEIEKLNKELRENSGVVAFGKDLQTAGQKMQDAGTKISSVGSTLTKSVTVPLAAAGAAAVKLATDFETSIAKLNSIADTTEKPISKLTDEIMRLSDETGIAAAEISEQAYQAISAGQSTANAVNFVSNATKLAKAGFAETGQALDVLTTILNAYGKSGAEAGAVSDRLIQTQNLGKVTVAQLAESMGKAIPTAASYGVNLDNVAATYVTLTKQGIKADVATTQLNGIMNQLGKSGTVAADALKKKTGKTFKELMESGYGLSDVLKIVQEAAEEDGVALNDMFGNVRAAAGAIAIMNDGGETFTKTLKSMSSAAGTTEKAFKTVTNTTAYKFQKSLNQVKNAGIEAGQSLLIVLAPSIEKITNLIDKGAKAFGAMSKEEQQAILKTLGFAAAIGPTVQLIGGVTTGIGKATQAAGKLIEVFGLTGSVPVSGIMGIAGAALALNAALAQTYTHVVQANNEILTNAKNTQAAASEAAALREEVEKTATAYGDSASEMEKNEKRADALADKIEALTKNTNRSASENRELQAAVEELNEIYPSMNLQIDAQTGKLNKSNAEIRKNIEALRQQARAQAAMERAVEINRQIIDVEIQLEELHGKTAKAAQDVANATKAMAEESEKYGTVSGRAKITVDEATKAEQALNAEITAQEQTLQGLQTQLQTTEGYLETHSTALESTQEAAGQTNAVIDETVEAFDTEAQAAEAAALKMLEAAHLQVGAFEEVEEAQTVSIQKLIEGLQSQVEAQQNYRKNLETLYSYIEQDSSTNWSNLIAILQEGGIGMAGELQGIVEAIQRGDTDALTELANLTTGIGSETVRSADALGELSGLSEEALDETAEAIKKSAPKVQTEAKLAAEGMKTGYKKGAQSAGPIMATDAKTSAITKPAAEISRNKTSLMNATRDAAAAMGPGFKSGSNTAAASTKADAQKAAVTGPAASISSSKGQLQSAAQSAAATMGPGFKAGSQGAAATANEAAGGVVLAGAEGFSKNKGTLQKKAGEVGAAGGQAFIDEARKKRSGSEEAGKYVGEGFGVGIEAKKGYIAQKAREAAEAANRAFINTEEIGSPSKVTTKYGEFTSIGFANGIKNKIGAIRTAATQAAQAANTAISGGSHYMSLPEGGTMDPDQLYAAVRSGASDAVHKIYLGGRELTRSLQDMGVSFTYG